MKKPITYLYYLFIAVISILIQNGCKSPTQPINTNTLNNYASLIDTVKYVGINTCKLCHQDIYNTFIETGMGKSFDTASQSKSSANFANHPVVKDTDKNLFYIPSWQQNNLVIKEFRLSGKDTIYTRTEIANYIIGSGQHTNSHLYNINGYLRQMPLTYYTQKGKWDLPPGFENGNNSRFSRKIGLECMSCHNSLPEFVEGSENKYTTILNGIGCERCHGPGSAHVQQKMAGIKIDTSKYIDYSIVNPAKLPIDLQFDVCQRCHLQGNTVLNQDKSFFDFKPGMKLSDIMTVFLPKYSNSDKDFIMASHADRLKMSKCFSINEKNKNSTGLRPYQNGLTCVTCHNPHVSVKATNKEHFNLACKNCHNSTAQPICSASEKERSSKENNCISCHMPRSGSIDIPHVTVTDHYIHKPISTQEVNSVKQFLGLFAINNNYPSAKTKAAAYLNQYEKFESENFYLDSAKKYLPDYNLNLVKENFDLLIRWAFLKNDAARIIEYVKQIGEKNILNTLLTKRSLSNDNAWTCYRIGESFSAYNQHTQALTFYTRATELAKYNLEFQNKLGATLISLNKLTEAVTVFDFIISEDPYMLYALNNRGYLALLNKNIAEAEQYYLKAIKLDPDYIPVLLNYAGLYLYKKDKPNAEKTLKQILAKDPKNVQAKSVLNNLKKLP